MDERSKKILEAEKDPLILRALIAQLAAENYLLKSVIEKRNAEEEQKKQTGLNLEERVKLLKRSLYGRSKEDRKAGEREATDRPRDKSQVEASLFAQSAFPADQTRDENEEGKKRGWDLEEVVIDHLAGVSDLLEEARLRGVDSPTADQWIKTGLYDESTKITIIERKYVRELHRKHKYKLKSEVNPDPDKDVIVTAGGTPELLPGMNYTTDFVAAVVADKYISHMPLERQTREMESLGLKDIKNATLSRLSALAAASLEPIAESILKEDLLTSTLALHLDETPWKIQNKKQKDGYMWVISNSSGSYYFFKPTRSATVITEKLGSYKGPIVTDGYTSYDDVLNQAKIPHAYCWSHARREFLPLEDHDPTIKPILDLIDKCFAVEREATTFEELIKLRTEKTTTYMNDLQALLLAEHPRSRGQSQKRKAIEYTLKRWPGLTMFLTDQRIPMSNNEAERTIRHAVVGRKNYYGAGSHSGAETAATLFTVIESCKKNDVDPRSFLIMSLHRVARGEELETPLAYARRIRQPAN
jgi:transposase